MRHLTRLPVILAFFAVGIVLSAVSFIPKFIYLSGETIDLKVPAMGDCSTPVEYTGFVKAQASVPEGVEVYILTEGEYERYLNDGALPKRFISNESDSVWVRNPYMLVAVNGLDSDVDLSLNVEVYERRMPYALLSIPAYLVTVFAAALLMFRVVKKFGEEMGISSS